MFVLILFMIAYGVFSSFDFFLSFCSSATLSCSSVFLFQVPFGYGSKRTPLGTTGFSLFFLLPIGFFRHPFLTHSHFAVLWFRWPNTMSPETQVDLCLHLCSFDSQSTQCFGREMVLNDPKKKTAQVWGPYRRFQQIERFVPQSPVDNSCSFKVNKHTRSHASMVPKLTSKVVQPLRCNVFLFLKMSRNRSVKWFSS